MGEFADFAKNEIFGFGRAKNPREKDPLYHQLLQHFQGDRIQADGAYDEMSKSPEGRWRLMRTLNPIAQHATERPEDRWDYHSQYHGKLR